jgi:hypothetical protein
MQDPKLSRFAVDFQAEAFAALFNGSSLEVYSGTRPTDPDSSLGSQKLLATLRFSNPAFASPADGLLTAKAILMDPEAKATGKAEWFRVRNSDGNVILDGTAGVPDLKAQYDLNLKSADIQQNAEVGCESFTLRFRKSK